MKRFEFDGNWTQEYQFEAFKGLQSRRGTYASTSSEKVSDGTISLTIIDDTSETPDPSIEQINAINYLLEHPDEIMQAMRNGIDSIYETLKAQYGYNENNPDTLKWFPEINTLQEYDHIFGVRNVYIQLPSKEGYSYVGIECGCTWDEEHGLGFLLHKNRIVGIGSADEALNWNANKDNGTIEEVQEKLKQNAKKEPIKYQPHPKYGKLKPSQKTANEAYESDLIRRGFNDKFKEEVEKGNIDINGTHNIIDRTYLELAISVKNIELTRYLLSRGAKMRFAFHQTRKDLALIDLLVEHKGNINSTDIGGNTVIYKATMELVGLYDHRNQSEKYNWQREEELTDKINNQKTYLKELMLRGANPLIQNRHQFNCLNASRNLPLKQQEEINNFFESSKLSSQAGKKEKKKNKSSWKFWRKK